MASFPICPLIDTRTFLGVSDDSDPNCMIVSLGKKIIMRFRLTDQKQLSSWTTKEKLSSPVYYDKDRNEYFCIYNGDLLSQWSKDKYRRNNQGKYKLPCVVQSVHVLNGIRPIILFIDGTVACLALEKKKAIDAIKENALPDGEIIETRAFSFSGYHFLCFRLEEEGVHKLKFSVISSVSDDQSFEIELLRKGSDSTLSCFTVVEDKGLLLTLWSDGCLFSLELDITSQNNDFPGRCIMKFSVINCVLPCTILALDNNHVAVYGADSNGEGAKVIWLEVNYGVIQNSLHLKLYCNPPQLWKISNSYLITPVGLYLTVIPYKLKNSPTLDSVLAAQKSTQMKTTLINWENDYHCKNMISSEIDDSLPEHILSQNITSKFLEQNKIKEAIDSLSRLSDVPDKCVIDTLVTTLNSNLKNKNDLIVKSLKFPVLNDNETLCYLREKLPYSSVSRLMDILLDLVEREPENENTIKWLTLLIDAHYQEYLLTKDEDVVKRLVRLKQLVDSIVVNMQELQHFYKLLTGSLKTKLTSKTSVQYSVDKFRLY